MIDTKKMLDLKTEVVLSKLLEQVKQVRSHKDAVYIIGKKLAEIEAERLKSDERNTSN